MENTTQNPDFTDIKDPNPETPFPMPADPLTAASLLRPPEETARGLDLGDLVHGMRVTLSQGALPEAETMLATQAHIMNAAFNRLLIAATNCRYPDAHAIDTAVRVQRRCAQTLGDLERRMEKIFGKQTDKNESAADRP